MLLNMFCTRESKAEINLSGQAHASLFGLQDMQHVRARNKKGIFGCWSVNQDSVKSTFPVSLPRNCCTINSRSAWLTEADRILRVSPVWLVVSPLSSTKKPMPIKGVLSDFIA